MIFQILFSLFALLVMGTSMQTGRRQGMSNRGMALWGLLWLVAIGIVWVPSTTDFLAQTFGIGRGVDVVLYSTIPVLFFLLFRLHIKIALLESQITQVVRRDAIDQVTKQ